MAWRRMTTRLLIGLGIALVVSALSFVSAPDTAAEPVRTVEAEESRTSGLPRLEFEAPPAAVDRPGPVAVPGTLRGVMGYRLPLVSRQQVPAQVVSGVLLPAHTTYVILRPGHWELVGLSPAEVEALRAAANADDPVAQSEPVSRGWNLFRLFRRSGAE